MGERREEGVFTPSLLWNRFRENVPRGGFSVISVEGVFRGFNSDREYAGRRYGTLADANDGRTTIVLRIPRTLVSAFVKKEGDLFTLKGTPFWDMKPEFGRAEIVFDVKEVEGVEVFRNQLEETARVINEKARKGWKDVERVLREAIRNGKKPRIGMIIGETAIVHKDVLKALGETSSFYLIEFEKVSLVEEKSLVETLLLMDRKGYDLIALVRGGGSGLEIFDSPELAGTAVSLNTPFVTALGHAQDLHLLDKVADKHFITPTELGRFLHEVASAVSEVSRLKTKLEELEGKLHRLTEENSKLLREKANLERKAGSFPLKEKIYLGVIAILLLIIAWLVLK